MNRDQVLRTIGDRTEPWDVLIIGGGATGLGAAVDAASRGYATLLVEQHDFAKGTSSRSTKLIHGGVRYLAQGQLRSVRTALRERATLLRNAPHLVRDLPFIVPAYSLWELPAYFSGLKVYDLLAGSAGRRRSRWLSRGDTLDRAPTLVSRNLRGGILYHDCQFDDSRLAVTLARTLVDLGGAVVNYMGVTSLSKAGGKICGVRVRDIEINGEIEIAARVVINATGVFVDRILKMDDENAPPLITPSRGIHVVLERQCLPGECAVVVPHTDDRRILFAIPWHGKVLVGTTDTPQAEPVLEPKAASDDLDFLLENAARYLTSVPERSEILSMFAGLRPLVAGRALHRTASVSRDHHIEVSASGLVTIAGGKWTTYRHMGEDVIDEAARVGGLPERKSTTRELPLHGWCAEAEHHDPLSVYGADAAAIRQLAASHPGFGDRVHERLPYLKAEVAWAARNEMARTIEDVLARRTRALFLDARAALEAAATVAALLAVELGRSPDWQRQQIAEFTALAKGYLP